jgi:hypothetical protein
MPRARPFGDGSAISSFSWSFELCARSADAKELVVPEDGAEAHAREDGGEEQRNAIDRAFSLDDPHDVAAPFGEIIEPREAGAGFRGARVGQVGGGTHPPDDVAFGAVDRKREAFPSLRRREAFTYDDLELRVEEALGGARPLGAC